MQIGELARQAGTTAKAVRFYESQGLLSAPARAANGYRQYGSADVERLRLLVGLRTLDLPLDRAGELAALRLPGSPTIRIDGRDVDPSYRDPVDYTPRCRLYRTSGGLRGLPERAWVGAALRASLLSQATGSSS